VYERSGPARLLDACASDGPAAATLSGRVVVAHGRDWRCCTSSCRIWTSPWCGAWACRRLLPLRGTQHDIAKF
jgi:hypothetical protein